MPLPQPGDAILDFYLGPIRVERLKVAQEAAPALSRLEAPDGVYPGLDYARDEKYLDPIGVDPTIPHRSGGAPPFPQRPDPVQTSEPPKPLMQPVTPSGRDAIITPPPAQSDVDVSSALSDPNKPGVGNFLLGTGLAAAGLAGGAGLAWYRNEQARKKREAEEAAALPVKVADDSRRDSLAFVYDQIGRLIPDRSNVVTDFGSGVKPYALQHSDLAGRRTLLTDPRISDGRGRFSDNYAGKLKPLTLTNGPNNAITGVIRAKGEPLTNPGFVDRNWPALLGAVGGAGLGYAAYNAIRDKDEEKKADAALDQTVEAGRNIQSWANRPENQDNVTAAAASGGLGLGVGVSVASMLGGAYGAATAPKGYLVQSGLRGAGQGAGAALGVTAAGVGHSLFGDPSDLATGALARIGGGLAGRYLASKAMGPHPAERDRKLEEERRAKGTDDESLKLKLLQELLGSRKQANPVADAFNATKNWGNNNIVQPVTNGINSAVDAVSSRAGNNAANAFKENLGIGGDNSLLTNPYVIGGGIGALAGGGLAAMGSGRKKKRLGDIATGGLLGAGAGLLGGGLYSMWQSNQPPAPETPTPPVTPVTQVQRETTNLINRPPLPIGEDPNKRMGTGWLQGFIDRATNTPDTVRNIQNVTVPGVDAAHTTVRALYDAGRLSDAHRLAGAYVQTAANAGGGPEKFNPALGNMLQNTVDRHQGRADSALAAVMGGAPAAGVQLHEADADRLVTTNRDAARNAALGFGLGTQHTDRARQELDSTLESQRGKALGALRNFNVTTTGNPDGVPEIDANGNQVGGNPKANFTGGEGRVMNTPFMRDVGTATLGTMGARALLGRNGLIGRLQGDETQLAAKDLHTRLSNPPTPGAAPGVIRSTAGRIGTGLNQFNPLAGLSRTAPNVPFENQTALVERIANAANARPVVPPLAPPKPVTPAGVAASISGGRGGQLAGAELRDLAAQVHRGAGADMLGVLPRGLAPTRGEHLGNLARGTAQNFTRSLPVGLGIAAARSLSRTPNATGLHEDLGAGLSRLSDATLPHIWPEGRYTNQMTPHGSPADAARQQFREHVANTPALPLPASGDSREAFIRDIVARYPTIQRSPEELDNLWRQHQQQIAEAERMYQAAQPQRTQPPVPERAPETPPSVTFEQFNAMFPPNTGGITYPGQREQMYREFLRRQGR